MIGPFETSDLNTRGGIAAHAARMLPAYARMGAERGMAEAPWTPEVVDRVVADRRSRLPLEEWADRVAWRDRILALLLAARRERRRPVRSAGSELRAGEETVPVTFEGRVLAARRGESLAATLAAHGVTVLRETRGGAERGVFCGMGVCQDCLVTIDGRPNLNACMTVVTGRWRWSGRSSRPRFPFLMTSRGRRGQMPSRIPTSWSSEPARAASPRRRSRQRRARVLVLDERSKPGGQYFKQPGPGLDLQAGIPDDSQFAGGRRLIARAARPG